MPRYPDTVEVKMAGGGYETWEVKSLGTCKDDKKRGRKGCGERVFFCITHLKRWAVVDSLPVDDGSYVAHQATCEMLKKKPAEDPKPSHGRYRRDVDG